ncbi:MAG: ribonuclease domain-containing protein [Synechococcus sp.]
MSTYQPQKKTISSQSSATPQSTIASRPFAPAPQPEALEEAKQLHEETMAKSETVRRTGHSLKTMKINPGNAVELQPLQMKIAIDEPRDRYKSDYQQEQLERQTYDVAQPVQAFLQLPIQMVKPADKVAAQKLTTGSDLSSGYEVGMRHYQPHKGIELKAQLTKAGDENIPTSFTEYDVNPKPESGGRDAERIVVGDNGRIWYTGAHYAEGSFEELT